MNEADVVQPHELTHTECMVVVAVGVLVAGYTLYMTNFGYGAMLCSAIAGVIALCCGLMIRLPFVGALVTLAVFAIGFVLHMQVPLPSVLIVVVAGVLAVKSKPWVGSVCIVAACVMGLMDTNMYLYGVDKPNRISIWLLCMVISIGGGMGLWLHGRQQRIGAAVAESNRRRRIARTLHDQVANDVNDVIMMVEYRLMQSGPDPQLERIRSTSTHALESIRHVIVELEDCEVSADAKPPSRNRDIHNRDIHKESALCRKAREYDNRLHAAGFHGELLIEDETQGGGGSEANSELIDDLMHELFGNMMKYADKEKPYFILVSSTESQIGIGVTNMVRNCELAQSGLGSGMRALRERIHKIGGTLEMGWDGPYWNVHASVPVI